MDWKQGLTAAVVVGLGYLGFQNVTKGAESFSAKGYDCSKYGHQWAIEDRDIGSEVCYLSCTECSATALERKGVIEKEADAEESAVVPWRDDIVNEATIECCEGEGVNMRVTTYETPTGLEDVITASCRLCGERCW